MLFLGRSTPSAGISASSSWIESTLSAGTPASGNYTSLSSAVCFLVLYMNVPVAAVKQRIAAPMAPITTPGFDLVYASSIGPSRSDPTARK